MKDLYSFIVDLYEKYGVGIGLDEFINEFMVGTFTTDSLHEAFLQYDNYLCYYRMDYKIDHKNKKIELLFVEK